MAPRMDLGQAGRAEPRAPYPERCWGEPSALGGVHDRQRPERARRWEDGSAGRARYCGGPRTFLSERRGGARWWGEIPACCSGRDVTVAAVFDVDAMRPLLPRERRRIGCRIFARLFLVRIRSGGQPGCQGRVPIVHVRNCPLEPGAGEEYGYDQRHETPAILHGLSHHLKHSSDGSPALRAVQPRERGRQTIAALELGRRAGDSTGSAP